MYHFLLPEDSNRAGLNNVVMDNGQTKYSDNTLNNYLDKGVDFDSKILIVIFIMVAEPLPTYHGTQGFCKTQFKNNQSLKQHQWNPCSWYQVQEAWICYRVAGKPEKPPNSGYSLFSRIMLVSPEIKQVAAKERMSQISKLWKSMTEGEKKKYQEQVNHVSNAASCTVYFAGFSYNRM